MTTAVDWDVLWWLIGLGLHGVWFPWIFFGGGFSKCTRVIDSLASERLWGVIRFYLSYGTEAVPALFLRSRPWIVLRVRRRMSIEWLVLSRLAIYLYLCTASCCWNWTVHRGNFPIVNAIAAGVSRFEGIQLLALIRSALKTGVLRDSIDVSNHNRCTSTQTVLEETEWAQES